MEYRVLGSSDLSVSVIGLGCWSFGGGAYWGPSDQNVIEKVVLAALDEGINYFDTAESYNDGESERSLGKALQGHRTKAIIGTKISPSHTYSPKVIEECCKDSLQRLSTDYIDLYMLHWPLNPKSIAHFSKDGNIETVPSVEEVFHTLQRLQEIGYIRYIGISNHGVHQMQELLDKNIPIIANELPYNLVSRAIEKDILPFCEVHRIGVIGYMALQQGLLTGRYTDFSEIPPPQAHSRHFHYSRGKTESRHGENGAEPEIMDLLENMRELALELGTPVTTLSLSWALKEKRIGCTLVGCRSLEKLQENIHASEFPLPQEAYQLLTRWSDPVLETLGFSADYYESRKESRVF